MTRTYTHIFAFDAYGTVFDVHSAISEFRSVMGPDADRMSEIWRAKQLEYTWTLTLAGHYADFWTLTERTLDFALARVPSVPKNLKPALLDAYSTLKAFPDTKLALQKLQIGGHKTCILSNGSPEMLQNAIAYADLTHHFDAVFSVDKLKMFKTRPEVYAMVTDHYKCEPSNVSLVSSNRWDIMAAKSFGFRPLWVNRAKLPDEYLDFPPAQTFSDLTPIGEL